MSGKKHKKFILVLLLLLFSSVGYIILQNQRLKKASATPPPPAPISVLISPHPPGPLSKPDGTAILLTPGEHDITLADLGTRPDWQTLDLWQETITHDDFLRLLMEVYTVDHSWKRYITVHPDHAIIRTDTRKTDAYYRLTFSKHYNDSSPDRSWNSVDDLPPASAKKPLADLRIAIDPGHIGGEFAKIEQRWFQIGDHKPVMEGELTLATAKLIKRKLPLSL